MSAFRKHYLVAQCEQREYGIETERLCKGIGYVSVWMIYRASLIPFVGWGIAVTDVDWNLLCKRIKRSTVAHWSWVLVTHKGESCSDWHLWIIWTHIDALKCPKIEELVFNALHTVAAPVCHLLHAESFLIKIRVILIEKFQISKRLLWVTSNLSSNVIEDNLHSPILNTSGYLTIQT